MSGYNRLWGNINTGVQKRRVNCLHMEAIQQKRCQISVIKCQLEIAASYLDEALSSFDNKTKNLFLDLFDF